MVRLLLGRLHARAVVAAYPSSGVARYGRLSTGNVPPATAATVFGRSRPLRVLLHLGRGVGRLGGLYQPGVDGERAHVRLPAHPGSGSGLLYGSCGQTDVPLPPHGSRSCTPRRLPLAAVGSQRYSRSLHRRPVFVPVSYPNNAGALFLVAFWPLMWLAAGPENGPP